MSESEHRHAAVKPARGPRYGRSGALNTGDAATSQRPACASRSSDPVYRRVRAGQPPEASNALQRNRTYAVLSALPVLMLVIGLSFSYLSERRQSNGAPIRAASVQLSGRFDGFTRVGIGAEGRHYLWLQTEERRRGVRIRAAQARRLGGELDKGQRIVIDAAPSVEGSRTRWLWRLRRQAQTLLDDSDRLR